MIDQGAGIGAHKTRRLRGRSPLAETGSRRLCVPSMWQSGWQASRRHRPTAGRRSRWARSCAGVAGPSRVIASLVRTRRRNSETVRAIIRIENCRIIILCCRLSFGADSNCRHRREVRANRSGRTMRRQEEAKRATRDEFDEHSASRMKGGSAVAPRSIRPRLLVPKASTSLYRRRHSANDDMGGTRFVSHRIDERARPAVRAGRSRGLVTGVSCSGGPMPS